MREPAFCRTSTTNSLPDGTLRSHIAIQADQYLTHELCVLLLTILTNQQQKNTAIQDSRKMAVWCRVRHPLKDKDMKGMVKWSITFVLKTWLPWPRFPRIACQDLQMWSFLEFTNSDEYFMIGDQKHRTWSKPKSEDFKRKAWQAMYFLRKLRNPKACLGKHKITGNYLQKTEIQLE